MLKLKTNLANLLRPDYKSIVLLPQSALLTFTKTIVLLWGAMRFC